MQANKKNNINGHIHKHITSKDCARILFARLVLPENKYKKKKKEKKQNPSKQSVL